MTINRWRVIFRRLDNLAKARLSLKGNLTETIGPFMVFWGRDAPTVAPFKNKYKSGNIKRLKSLPAKGFRFYKLTIQGWGLQHTLYSVTP